MALNRGAADQDDAAVLLTAFDRHAQKVGGLWSCVLAEATEFGTHQQCRSTWVTLNPFFLSAALPATVVFATEARRIFSLNTLFFDISPNPAGQLLRVAGRNHGHCATSPGQCACERPSLTERPPECRTTPYASTFCLYRCWAKRRLGSYKQTEGAPSPFIRCKSHGDTARGTTDRLARLALPPCLID